MEALETCVRVPNVRITGVYGEGEAICERVEIAISGKSWWTNRVALSTDWEEVAEEAEDLQHVTGW